MLTETVESEVERERLQALLSYEILDTGVDPAFEDFAQLASAFCETPVALVSLVDRDRQWFKARVNFPQCETDLDRSVCRFVVAAKAPIIIPDLTADPRTQANPLVTGEPFIRFYAGAPLTTRDGHVLGALCVIDQQPRPAGLTPQQLEMLEALARRTVDTIEMRQVQRSRDVAQQGRDRAEAEQAASELRWRTIFETLREGFILGRVLRDAAGRMTDWRYEDVNAAWAELVGVPVSQARGRTIREVLPGIEEAWIYEFAPVVEAGETVRFTRQVGASGRWYDCFAQPMGADLFAVLFTEATERVETSARQNALLELGDALRASGTIADMTRTAARLVGRTLNASRAGYGVVDGQFDRVDIEPDWTADGVTSIAGRYRFQDFGRINDELRSGEPLVIADVITDPRTADDPAPMQTLGIAALINMPVREHGRTVGVFIVHDTRPRGWTDAELAFVREVADRLESGIARLRSEQQQQLVNGEVSHRLKNMLAMVQAIAGQTLKGSADDEAFRNFGKRLQALSRAQDFLLQSSWESADLGAVVASVLEAAGVYDRCRLSGSPVKLGPRATLASSLLLHELATNAVKYGALSAEAGWVEVSWRLEGEAGRGELFLTWREVGGPPARPPQRKGFGSRLLRAGLVGSGGSDLTYGTEGFSACFRAMQEQLEQA